jgi:hypothetical protein
MMVRRSRISVETPSDSSVCRLVGGVDHCAPRDHRDVVALPVDAGLPSGVALLRYLTLDAPVEVLVLEAETGFGSSIL